MRILLTILLLIGLWTGSALANQQVFELRDLTFTNYKQTEKEVKDLQGHEDYAQSKVQYHQEQINQHTEKRDFYEVKRKEINAARIHKQGVLNLIKLDLIKIDKTIEEEGLQRLHYAPGDDWEEYIQKYQKKLIEIPRMPDYHDKLASYVYEICKEREPENPVKRSNRLGRSFDYSCLSMVRTFTAENMGWNRDALNDANSNGTFDKGFCQLNSAYHIKFIRSNDFSNSLLQLEYCFGVWQDAYNKATMPWYAYYAVSSRSMDVHVIE